MNLREEIETKVTKFFQDLNEHEETFKKEIAECRNMLEGLDNGTIDPEKIKTKLLIFREMASLYRSAISGSVAIERLEIMRKTGKMLTSEEIELVVRQIALIAIKYIPSDKQIGFVSEIKELSSNNL